MEIVDLWKPLPPMEDNKELIRRDLEKGLAPNLPYFIAGLDDVKKSISGYLSKIDSRFSYALISGRYGNGKTNLFKYLEYFFQQNEAYNIHVAHWRADVDKYDIVLFLLYIIQKRYSDALQAALRIAVERDKVKELCNSYRDSFSAIEEYVSKIVEKIADNDTIKTLIELGTGKLYDANSFNRLGLSKLTNYNRREILVFFLNVLAESDYYIIFCLDELEKIQEKSRARFQSFLTSYRELIDLSSYINGHLLLTAITDSVSQKYPLELYNPAFARRIENDKLDLKTVEGVAAIKQMAEELARVLGEELTSTSFDAIASAVNKKRKDINSTSELVRAVFVQLTKQDDQKTWEEMLASIGLKAAFDAKRKDILEEGALQRIYQKLFAPLTDYIKINSNSEKDYEVTIQRLQCVYSTETNRCYVFLFTSDIDANINRLRNVINEYPHADLLVFKPKELDITMGDLKERGIEQVKELIPYDPTELIALLELYLDNYENDALRDVVTVYTHQL